MSAEAIRAVERLSLAQRLETFQSWLWMPCDDAMRGGREFGARAVVVDAIDGRAAEFYRHFGFRDLDETRLWRRLADISAALGG